MNKHVSPPPVTKHRFGKSSHHTWGFEPLTGQLVREMAREWEELAGSPAEPNIFQFPLFIRYSLPLLAGYNPWILAIRHDGLLIGTVILRQDMGYAKMPVPFWKTALHAEQYLGTPLVRAGFEEKFAQGLTGWLDQAPFHCGFLLLTKIASDGPVADALAAHCRSHRRGYMAANRIQRAGIAASANPAASHDIHFSPSRRKSLRRARKRLEGAGQVSIENLTEKEALEDWIDSFLEMEHSGWKGAQGTSILSCSYETGLYRAVIRNAFESENLVLTRLCLDKKPIAYTLDILSPPEGFCLKSAIHPKFRKFSPGVLMEVEVLKRYAGNRKLDFMDSCTHPDNAMLNELWPDKREIMDLAIARKGPLYGTMFTWLCATKSIAQRFSHD